MNKQPIRPLSGVLTDMSRNYSSELADLIDLMVSNLLINQPPLKSHQVRFEQLAGRKFDTSLIATCNE